MHGKMWSVAPESKRRGDLTLAKRHATAVGNLDAVYDIALDASNSAALLFAALYALLRISAFFALHSDSTCLIFPQ